MGLKCSVLGHRFDETAVERERHEEGTEVVITITEVETCSRCGESRVVSENKEVTTLETPDDADPAEAESPPDDDADRAAGAPGGASPADDDAEIIDAGAGEESTAQATARSEPTIPDAEDAPDDDPPEDDAIIIDGDDSSGTVDDAADAPASAAGAETGTDAGADARGGAGAGSGPATGDGADAEGGAGAGDETDAETRATDRNDDSWPDASEDDLDQPADPSEAADWPDDDAAVDDPSASMGDWPAATKRDPGASSTSDGPHLQPTESATITVPEGMFKCSECGFTTEVESSSLRAGDFCPDCHRGTLVQDTSENADAE